MEIDIRDIKSGKRFSLILDAEKDLFFDLRKGVVNLAQFRVEDKLESSI